MNSLIDFVLNNIVVVLLVTHVLLVVFWFVWEPGFWLIWYLLWVYFIIIFFYSAQYMSWKIYTDPAESLVSPFTLFNTILAILVFYAIIYIFQIPMTADSKELYISITEGALWFFLVVIAFVNLFYYAFGANVVNYLQYDYNVIVDYLRSTITHETGFEFYSPSSNQPFLTRLNNAFQKMFSFNTAPTSSPSAISVSSALKMTAAPTKSLLGIDRVPSANINSPGPSFTGASTNEPSTDIYSPGPSSTGGAGPSSTGPSFTGGAGPSSTGPLFTGGAGPSSTGPLVTGDVSQKNWGAGSPSAAGTYTQGAAGTYTQGAAGAYTQGAAGAYTHGLSGTAVMDLIGLNPPDKDYDTSRIIGAVESVGANIISNMQSMGHRSVKATAGNQPVKATAGNQPVEPPVDTANREVFHVSENKYTYREAQAMCRSLGATLATYDQIEDAYDNGADWYNYGWSEGQYAYFPMQKETWKNWMDGEDCAGRRRASKLRPGIAGGYFANPNIRFGINCYGVKPPKRDGDSMVKPHIRVPAPNKSLSLAPEKMARAKLDSFNSQKWSEF